jgi:hypothetical protein
VTDVAVVGDPKGDVFGNAAETLPSPANGNAQIAGAHKAVDAGATDSSSEVGIALP